MKYKLAFLFVVYLLLPAWFAMMPEQDWLLALFGSKVFAQTEQNENEREKIDFWDELRAVLSKKQDQDNKPLSATEKYPHYYNSIHQREQKFYDSLFKTTNFVTWDKYQDIIPLDVKRSLDTSLQNKLAPNIKVFGWHPYWMGSAYKSYHFDYLSYLAWFSYSIDPLTGKYKNPDVINLWKNSGELFDMAQKSGCKVLLTITIHSSSGNREFLKNQQSQNVLIDSLIVLMQGRGTGVDVNFENIPNGFEDELTLFLQNLSRRLKAANSDYILSVDLPIIDYYNTYQFNHLNNFVDVFIVRGYDFYNVLSKNDGPVAPLNAHLGELGIRQTVKKYLQKGLSRKKLLLGLPYYGGLWTAKTPGPGQRDGTLKFVKHLTYREVKRRYGDKNPNYDYNRWGAYYILPQTDSSYYEKCWFDDTITLGRKIDWALEEQLGGIGIWALGYDYGHEDMWNLIKNKLVSDTLLVYSGSYLENRHFKLGKSLMAYPSIIGVAGIFLAVFIVGGLVVALFDWRVREVFFQNKTLRLIYSMAAIAVLLSIYAFYLYVTEKPLLDGNNLFALGVGLTLVVGTTRVVGYFFEKRTKNLP